MTLFESFVYSAQFLAIPFAGLIVVLLGIGLRIYKNQRKNIGDGEEEFLIVISYIAIIVGAIITAAGFGSQLGDFFRTFFLLMRSEGL